MKNLYLILVLLPFAIHGQTFRLGTYVPIDIPIKHEMPKAGIASGLGLSLAIQPFKRIPVAMEMKGNLGIYSNRTLEQTYQFSDGSQTITDVNYTSNFHKALIGTRVSTGNQESPIRVFLTPQIGYGFMNSRIRIADPLDEDDCKPLEKRITQRFQGAIYGAELGLDMQFGKLIGSNSSDRHNRLIVSVNFLGSFKDFEYVNIKYMEDKPHEVAMGEHTIPEDDRDINATFVNVSSNNLHQHKIAELYKTPLSFIGVQIGYTYNF
jgi:hypothetical protein